MKTNIDVFHENYLKLCPIQHDSSSPTCFKLYQMGFFSSNKMFDSLINEYIKI
uniref:Uncharacterized protein n=1 Tax=Anguilla anguilla TaxID=7936 RepID=A0A0E9WY33_ANGAN